MDPSFLKISFDVGGVISKYPHVFRKMAFALVAGGVDVHVITDMHEKPKVIRMLNDNGWTFLEEDNVHCADYVTHGERCKSVLIKELGIDLHIDDFPGYCAGGGLQLMVWPDPDEPYWHDEWKTRPEDGDFGRRKKGNAE